MKNPFKFSITEQLQISLIALGGMIVMLILTGIYLVGWGVQSNVFKLIIILNAMCGIVFLSSSFIGTYQQYKMAKTSEGLFELSETLKGLDLLKGGNQNGEKV